VRYSHLVECVSWDSLQFIAVRYHPSLLSNDVSLLVTSEKHGRHKPTVFRSSPYNVVPLMGLLSEFVREVGDGLHSSISSSSLRQFLDSFTQKEFLQRILMTDCQQHMSVILGRSCCAL
jgi:hypothetical protein